MNVSFSIDASRFNSQMAALHDALVGSGQLGDAATIVQDSARLLLQEVIRKTPPDSLSQGRNAVARDIQRAMTPLVPEIFKTPSLRAAFERMNDEEWHYSDAEIEEFMRRAGWKNARILPFSPALHKSARDNRGRVSRPKGVLVRDVADLKKYISLKQANVGFMKAGWLPAFSTVGGKASQWIARHKQPAGFVVSHLQGEKPEIVLGNFTRGISQVRHAFESAMRTRITAMRNRVRLILSGYSKDIAAGMRPRKHAAQTSLALAA